MATKPANALLDTASPAAELNWSTCLELQVAAYFPYELSFFLGWPEWQTAHRVLDAGCGNGYFLAHLMKFFPDKAYTGVDLSAELISAAKQSPDLQKANVVQSDFFAFEPGAAFDIVILRLLVQHLSGLGDVLRQLEQLLKPGGSALIVEPDPAAFFNYPSTPIFSSLLATYARHAAQQRLNRASLSAIADELKEFKGWTITQDRTLVAPAIGPFRGTALMHVFAQWVNIFESVPDLKFPFAEARRELEEWSTKEVSFNQAGVRIVSIQRS